MSDDLKLRLKDMSVLSQSRTPDEALVYIKAIESKHKELTDAVTDLLGDTMAIIDDDVHDDEGHELWTDVGKFRRVFRAIQASEGITGSDQ